MFKLGRVPDWHQTGNSTLTTDDLRTGKRGFNEEYQGRMDHLGMRLRTIGRGDNHQKGDVEAQNGGLKRRLEQHLLLRGHRDFESLAAYAGWIEEVVERANRGRAARLTEELAVMKPLGARRLPQYRELRFRVSSEGTMRVQKNTYSVPSRLKGEVVVVRASEMDLEVFYGGSRQLVVDRLRGESHHRIDYRHIMWSLVKKSGSSPAIGTAMPSSRAHCFAASTTSSLRRCRKREADLHYLRTLHLAEATMQCDVFEAVKSLLRVHDPNADALRVELGAYDELLYAEAGR